MPSRPMSPNASLAIEVEIRAEKASALRRVGHRVESLLAELTQLQKELAGASGPTRERLVARHKQQRAEAEKQLWYLIVQREAMGLRQHDDIYEIYALPPAVK